MARGSPVEIDLAQLSQQFCADLTRSQSLEGAVACCTAFFLACFAPYTAQIVWDAGRGPRVLGAQIDASLQQPSAAEMAQLLRGELVIHDSSASDGRIA